MCTGIRFSDDKGSMFFGRNLDWSTGYGQKVVVTPRGYSYDSAFLGKQNPKHGAIIGMAIVEENTPLYFDCANEAGLAIAGLNFPGYASYAPDAIDGKTNVAAYEFPLWVAMNFQSVDEVEAALKDAVIVAKPINDKYPVSELHFIIGDKDRSIVVEYTERGMEIFHNDVDVLTNQPGYGWHKENLRNYMNLFPLMPKAVDWNRARLTAFGSGSLMRGIPGDYYAPSRFVRVAYLNTHYPVKSTEEENVSRLFHTLTGVAMIDGAAQMADGKCEITVYTGGYSAATKTYYYNTYENPAIVSVKMTDYNLDSADLVQV
ncbi:choloylglycine hydrolase [Candidatus Saccharibacteria bacterium]|nr:choloylglycine hydrolase [Candidatus Saccharibacteria bacterium]